MARDVDRAIAEALALAAQRGGSIAAVTLATREPCDAIVARARNLLARQGLADAEVILERCDSPIRLVALELHRN